MNTSSKLLVLCLFCLALPLLSGCRRGGSPPAVEPEDQAVLTLAEQAEVDKYIKEYGTEAIVHYLLSEKTHNADKERVLKYVNCFISQGADVNAKTSSGETPLHFAAMVGNLEVVKLLVSKGAVNDDDLTPLERATDNGHTAIVKYLTLLYKKPQQRQCSKKIKLIGLALHNYHDTHNAFPPLYTVDKDGKPLHSWRVLILPYLEQTALYEQIRLDEPWDSAHNKQFHDKMPVVYQCPENPGKGCCYSVIAGQGFAPSREASRWTGMNLSGISDGTSNTLAIIEVKQPFCWMDPTADVTLDELEKGINKGRVGSFHSGGCNVGFFDGATRFLPETIDTKILRALGTPCGGESASF